MLASFELENAPEPFKHTRRVEPKSVLKKNLLVDPYPNREVVNDD
jgi:hypothetical protein